MEVNKAWLRFSELIVLGLIAAGVIFALMTNTSEGFYSAAFLALGSVINAIRNQAQASVMNSLADHLARSVPVKEQDQ